MKRTKKVLAASLALLVTVGLAGCLATRPVDRLSTDDRYKLCIEAGGSWEYNASLPYWSCTVAGEKEEG